MSILTRGPQSNGVKRDHRLRSQVAEMGHKNPFQRDISSTIRRISTKPARHAHYGKCPLCHNRNKVKVTRDWPGGGIRHSGPRWLE